MIRRLSLVVSLCLLSVAPAGAQDKLTPLLLGAPDPVRTRAALLGFAAAVPPSDSADAGEAWRLAALSYHRAGMADSAIVCGRRAVETHATGEAVDALIDALQERRGADDLPLASALVQKRFRMMRFDAGPFDQANTQGRLAWSLFLDGKADSAHKDFKRARRLLDADNPMVWIWRRRVAMTAHAAGDRDQALEMCKGLAVRSWLQDRDALMLMHDVLGGDQGDARYAPFLRSELVHAQQADQARLDEVGARRITTTGIDGFPIATALYPTNARTRRLVIAIETETEELAHYDSLASALRGAGWALAVMDARGSGRSVAPACPTPESWSGREDAIESAVAGDVRYAFLAVARDAKLDTTAYVVMGSRGTAGIAVEAATLDPRAGAAVLLSPLPPPVELGRVWARLKSRGLATFIQTAPSDIGAPDVGAQLYDALDPKTSRLVDSEATGRGPMVFRFDGTAGPRLVSWLAERFPSKPAPRPAAPRTR